MKLLYLCLLAPTSIYAIAGITPQIQKEFEEKTAAVETNKQRQSGSQEVMIINPEKRAQDFKAAFDLLKSQAQSEKIVFLLTDKSTISGIMEVSVLPGGTMLSFMINTTRGVKYKIIPIEQIQSISR